ncbi:hypothetical protein AB205_0108690 [Aquarana catesbeiana]|uniref:Uncharacterized protein n=1 Tax=Aquarana catesbeiana TaxID=8400 RepID=A0A2G9SDR4_AQUCT|nr:hypothetical protein AB205_0108690 [Aquarana catesbeiana]
MTPKCCCMFTVTTKIKLWTFLRNPWCADDISSLRLSTVSSLWSLQHPSITEQPFSGTCVWNIAFGIF